MSPSIFYQLDDGGKPTQLLSLLIIDGENTIMTAGQSVSPPCFTQG